MWLWRHVLSEEPTEVWFELMEISLSDSLTHTELIAAGVTVSLFGELIGGKEQHSSIFRELQT